MKAGLITGFILVSVSLQAQLTDFQHINFDRADSVADVYSGEPLTDLSALSEKLTRSFASDEEKFRAIYKWVCSNIEFDYWTFQINHEKRYKLSDPEALRAWNKKIMPIAFRNLILEKKTVCTGYAWLLQQLSYHAGIACVIVDGYGRNAAANIRSGDKPNHSWNAVKLNNKWYLCDPTWSSGSYDTDRKVFIRKYDNSYFLADPNVFIRNHFPVGSRWALLEPQNLLSETEDSGFDYSPTLTEFLNGPLIYSSAYEYNITDLYPQTFDVSVSKNEGVNFSFSSRQPIEQVELAVHGPKHIQSFIPEFSKNEKGVYCFTQVFMKRGRHIVHLKLNNHYTLTYAVWVK